jgi:hypothetical protein
MRFRAIALLLSAVLCTAPARSATETDGAVRRIDAVAENPDSRIALASAIAERLGMHRNHLLRIRRESGRSFGQIFVATLRERGEGDEQIVREAGELLRDTENDGDESPRIAPVLTFSSALDRSAAATFYSFVPEAGIETRHAALVFGAPLYRGSAGGTVSSGMGDAYAAGSLHGTAGGLDLDTTLSIGFPTGNASLGLGAGKTTVDGSFTAGRSFERFRVFGSAGGSSFLFNNFIYQRPYVSDGPAAHFAGGGEWYGLRRLAVGAGGFAVRAGGSQSVTSLPGAEAWRPGHPRGHGPMSPAPATEPAGTVTTTATDVTDYGVNGWASLALTRNASLEFGAARSVAYSLTSVRVGIRVRVFGRGR